MAADIKLPKGRGEDAVISCKLFYDRSNQNKSIDRNLSLGRQKASLSIYTILLIDTGTQP